MSEREQQLHEGEWDWLSYVTQGRRQADFAAHCPKTVEVLESIPGFMTGLPFAYAFFSVLKPQVRPDPPYLLSRSSPVRHTHGWFSMAHYVLTGGAAALPQSSIKPHSAPCNLRLRCHFPLFVPDGCGIRVGDETRKWETGKPLVFDGASGAAWMGARA